MRTPVILQATQTECGLACVAMIINSHGTELGMSDLRRRRAVGRDGLTMRNMRDLLNELGYEAKAYRFSDIHQLGTDITPFIILWDNSHYVVVDKIKGKYVTVIDPEYGKSRISYDEFYSYSAGVALLCEPTDRKLQVKRSKFRELKSLLPHILTMKKDIAGFIVSLLLVMAVGVIPAAITSYTVDVLVPERELFFPGVLLILVLITFGVQALTSLSRALTLIRIERGVDFKMTQRLFSHLVSLPFSYFYGRPTGDLLLRFSSIANIRDAFTSRLIPLIIDLVTFFFYCVIIAFLSASYFGTLVVLGAVLVVTIAFYSNLGRQLTDAEIKARSRTQSITVDSLNSIENAKAMGQEHQLSGTFDSALTKETQASINRGFWDAIVTSVTGPVSFAAPMFFLFVGYMEVSSGNLTLGQMLGLNTLAASAISPLTGIATSLQVIVMTRVHVSRLFDVFDEHPENVEGVRFESIESSVKRIDFRGVCFRFEGAQTDVIHDASFSVEQGEVMAIAGPTGAGKSTIGRLICGLLSPTGGAVEMNGVDVETLSLQSIRSRIGVVTQGTMVSQGTIASNIRAGRNDVSDEALRQALYRACLLDEVDGMALGINTPLGERGVGLSGGQLQRLAIARAIVGVPSLLLLDEATANLDIQTEKSILSRLPTTRMVSLMITHRVQTVLRADKVLFVCNGRVAGYGSPRHLLSTNRRFVNFVKTAD